MCYGSKLPPQAWQAPTLCCASVWALTEMSMPRALEQEFGEWPLAPPAVTGSSRAFYLSGPSSPSYETGNLVQRHRNVLCISEGQGFNHQPIGAKPVEECEVSDK